MKVLIIEDDKYLQQVIRKILVKMGLEPVVCTDGNEALDLIVKEKVRLAIIDWILPGTDGLSLCRKVRKMRILRYLYMIVLTSKTKKEDLVDALDAGADDYIRKPFDEDELAARIRVGLRIIDLENKLVNNQKKLMKLAKEDPLTRILNRRALFDEMLRELNRASREDALIATILVDADNFKSINDTHGHLAGDLVLVEFAKRLRECCREYDKLGRYGGEEFLILLPKTTRDGAILVAERIRQSVKETPVEFLGNKIELTASVGIFTFSFTGEFKGAKVNERMLDDIIKKTNQALNVAKREGKNRVVIYNPS